MLEELKCIDSRSGRSDKTSLVMTALCRLDRIFNAAPLFKVVRCGGGGG